MKKEEKNMKDFEENIEEELEFDFDEEQLEEFTNKMQEFGKAMEKIGKKIGETVQKAVEKSLGHLEIDLSDVPHPPMPPMPPMPPRAPHAPGKSWSDISFNSDEREHELDKARAPMEKIKMLKEMRDKGMITQQDFETKRKQIIDEI
jgi:hypothetical protein